MSDKEDSWLDRLTPEKQEYYKKYTPFSYWAARKVPWDILNEEVNVKQFKYIEFCKRMEYWANQFDGDEVRDEDLKFVLGPLKPVMREMNFIDGKWLDGAIIESPNKIDEGWVRTKKSDEPQGYWGLCQTFEGDWVLNPIKMKNREGNLENPPFEQG